MEWASLLFPGISFPPSLFPAARCAWVLCRPVPWLHNHNSTHPSSLPLSFFLPSRRLEWAGTRPPSLFLLGSPHAFYMYGCMFTLARLIIHMGCLFVSLDPGRTPPCMEMWGHPIPPLSLSLSSSSSSSRGNTGTGNMHRHGHTRHTHSLNGGRTHHTTRRPAPPPAIHYCSSGETGTEQRSANSSGAEKNAAAGCCCCCCGARPHERRGAGLA
jgi:hypothetical protein